MYLPPPISCQGVVKPGLERLAEQYRTKCCQLAADLAGLREQHGSRMDAVNEKHEENLYLEQQVGVRGV